MFSKPRSSETIPQPAAAPLEPAPELRATPSAAPQKPKAATSILSSDLTITGNVRSGGDVQIEGTVEGDIRAHTLIIGETATVQGEVAAEEVVVHGRVVGRLRGLKVRLTASARVEGDIVHKTIAIESGAHFEGSVHRQEDPLSQGGQPPAYQPRLTPPPAPKLPEAAE